MIILKKGTQETNVHCGRPILDIDRPMYSAPEILIQRPNYFIVAVKTGYEQQNDVPDKINNLIWDARIIF